jgi:putative glutamine amidotransferase
MRPLVGIPPHLDDQERWRPGRIYHYLDVAYARAVEAAGGTPLYLPLQRDAASLLARIDGLLVPGGGDFLPDRAYPDEVAFDRVPDDQLDFDRQLLAAALEQRKPLLGICYGMQLLALHHGARLLHHVPLDAPHFGRHQLAERDGRHALQVEPGSRLAAVLGDAASPVNSLHHQGVASAPAPLRVSARAPDGLIEAIEREDLPFCLGVQWHPEKLPDPHRQRLFSAFVAACAAI